MANPTSMATRNTTLSRLKLAAVGVAGLLTSANLAALGLGTLDVQSNLDQPLNGVIELRVSAGDDLSSVSAVIASQEDFENLGIDYPSYLSDLSISIERIDGNSVLRVVSNDVIIKEPFIHFLVRVDWSGGSFLREYTALIDPPVYASETPQAVAQPRAVGTDQSYQTDSSYSDESAAEIAAEDIQVDESEAVSETFSETANQQVDESYNDEYQEPSLDQSQSDATVSSAQFPTDAQYGPVASGESLSVIAAELQRQFPDLSIYQIMQVLFEENRNAFIEGNINGLLQGSVLNIGDLNAIRAVDIAQAKQFFYDQVTAWDPASLITDSSYDDGLRVGQDEYSYNDDFSSDSSSTSSSFDTTTDAFQVGSSTETDSFSGAEGNNRDGEVLALQQEISDLQTSLSSSTLENQELTERISILEGQLADMNRLVSLNVESADLAGVEATLAEQNNADGSAAVDQYVDDYASDTSADLVDQVDELLDDDSAVDPLLAVDQLSSDEVLADADSNLDGTLSDTGELVDDGTLLADGSDEFADSAASEEAAAPVAPVRSAPEPGFFESLKSSIFDGGLWKILAGVGVLLLGGLGMLFMRRRRADEEFEISMLSIETQSQSVNEPSAITEVVADVEDKSPDRETSFLTVYSDSDAVVQADEVDPIAEADVYIAYGRDEQAEEVLLDGIASKPGRVDIKQKLLGLYHKNSNVEGFERIAEELYSQKNFLTSQVWQEVSLMGKDIAPNNPLFDVSASELLADELPDVDADQNADVGGGETVSEAADTNADSGSATTDVNSDAEASDSATVAAADVDPGNTELTAEVDASSGLDFTAEASDVASEEPVADEQAVAAGDFELDDIEEDDEFPFAEEDPSINLINFDDGRSEISELDDIEIDALDFDEDETEAVADEDEQASTVNVETVEIDLSDAIDLDKADGEDSGSSGNIQMSASQEVSDLEVDEDYDETRTQYELAKVFVDLGDEDGARKILEDIVSSSDTADEVMSDASELLESINS